MISANSGIDTAMDGLAELNGSNDTVTKCRFATANTTKISASGITIKAVKNFRMNFSSRIDEALRAQRGRRLCAPRVRSCAGFGVLAVQPFAHFLAGLEERHALLVDGNVGASARVAARARGPMLDRESAKTAQFDAIAARQRSHDLIENRVHDILDIPLVKVRVVLGNALNEFGFDHKVVGPG